MGTPTHDARLAVLIDADNANAENLAPLLVEIAKYGTATVRRAYGDWTSTRLEKWKLPMLAQSVQPIQQFAYTKGKNSTDSALIIEAMDLLHGGTVDGFCLVSSDSDFTRLAARIREQGLMAYGFGERKTPKPFVAACTKFIYVDNLPGKKEELASAPATPVVKKVPMPNKLLTQAVDTAAGDDGWAHLGAVGSNLSRLMTDFDSRTWGYTKLKDLMAAHGSFEVTSRPTGEGKAPNAYVRRAPRKSS